MQPPPGINAPVEAQVIQAPPPTRKSYQSAKDAKMSTQYIFDIDGTDFETRPGRVPGSVQIDFSGMTVTRDPETMWNYFRCAFVDAKGMPLEDEYERFKAYLDDPQREVSVDLLVEIIRDMIEFANGLPTGRSNS